MIERSGLRFSAVYADGIEAILRLRKNFFALLCFALRDNLGQVFTFAYSVFELTVQNDMPTTLKSQLRTPEVVFQCGGHLFSETRCSDVSVVD